MVSAMGYKYFIKKGGKGYYFGLFPNNNNNQPLAISGDYTTYKEAEEAIVDLKSLMKSSTELFHISKEDTGYFFKLIENDKGIVFHRDIAFPHRYEALHCIERVYKNFDAPLKIK